jgi:hypothetical protein
MKIEVILSLISGGPLNGKLISSKLISSNLFR